MNKNISISDVLKLSISERIQFVEDVWDSIANVPSSIKISKKQKEDLDKRLEAYHCDPMLSSPWSEIRNKFIKK